MDKKPLSKSLSLFLILLMYICAAGIGILTYWLLSMALASPSTLLLMLLADIAATITIWIFSLVTKNSSVYDPYWSVAPLLLVAGFIYLRGTILNAVDYIVFFVILIWSVRLTVNWALGWKGMEHEDWRYRKFRKQYPELWHLINFFGIQLFPTLAVFAGLVPVYFAVNQTSGYIETAFAVAGAIVCLAAVALEFFADRQMHRFRANSENKNQCIETGLWSISRHPNYIGEVLFWVGLFVTSIPCFGVFTFFGPDNFVFALLGIIIMPLMFLFISIPLMEKHILRKRPQYADYQKRVAKFIPFNISKILDQRAKRIAAPTAVIDTSCAEENAEAEKKIEA